MFVITEPAEAELQQTRAQAHSNCVVCGSANDRSLHVAFAASGDGAVHADFQCEEAFEGYTGMLHGGVVASLLDGAMTNCLFARGVGAVTAELTIRFRRPVATGTAATVQARVDRSKPPLHLLSAEIVQDGKAKAIALGKFMEYVDPAKECRCARPAESYRKGS